MKEKYFLNLVVLLLFFNLAQAQSPSISIGCTAPVANSFDGRPNGQGHVYVASIANFSSCSAGVSCKFKWEVTNGRIVGASPQTPGVYEADQANNITVYWNNVNQAGKVKVTSSASSISGCSSCPGLTTEKNINIKYLGTPGYIKVNGVEQSGAVQIPCAGVSMTLSVDAVTNATNYQWITPWGTYNGQTVNVTSTSSTTGGIRVQASRSDVPSFTTTSALLEVERLTPHLYSVTAAPITVLCNTSQSGSAYAVATFFGSDSFIWTTTGGVKVNGTSGTIITPQANDGSVTVAITATSDGTYSVRAYNSACATSSPEIQTRTVYFGPPTMTSGSYQSNGSTYGLVESEDPPYPNAFCYAGTTSIAVAKINYLRATSNTWMKVASTPSNLAWSQNQYGGVDITFKAANQQVLFNLNYANICGNTTKFYGFRSINCFQALTVFPNPSTQNTVTIQFDNVENEEVMPQQIALFSEKSTTPVRTISATDVFKRKAFKDNNKIEIDTRGLEKGVYYLHITHAKKVNKETEKIRLLIDNSQTK